MTREQMIDEAVAEHYGVKIGRYCFIGGADRARAKRDLPKLEAGRLPGAVAVIRGNFRRIYAREQMAANIQEHGT